MSMNALSVAIFFFAWPLEMAYITTPHHIVCFSVDLHVHDDTHTLLILHMIRFKNEFTMSHILSFSGHFSSSFRWMINNVCACVCMFQCIICECVHACVRVCVMYKNIYEININHTHKRSSSICCYKHKHAHAHTLLFIAIIYNLMD